MLKREDLPTFGRPTIPILRLLPGLPSLIFCSGCCCFFGGILVLFFADWNTSVVENALQVTNLLCKPVIDFTASKRIVVS